MSCMFVARFDSVPSAKSAAHALIAEGFDEDAVRLFRGGRHAGASRAWEPPIPSPKWSIRYCFAWRTTLLAVLGTSMATFGAILTTQSELVIMASSSLGACGGVALGAWWAGRWLAAWRLAWLQTFRESGHGVLLAVHAEPDDQNRVFTLLRDAGGFQIDHEYGQWSEGRWVERDAPPHARVLGNVKVHRHTQWQL